MQIKTSPSQRPSSTTTAVRPTEHAAGCEAGALNTEHVHRRRNERSRSALARTRLLSASAIALLCALPAPQAPAQNGDRSGKQVVEATCARCHVPGTDGAPRIGDRQAWHERASQGLSSLTRHALDGIRKMPAHGGELPLSDLEIARAVTYMVNQSGGKWVEPASTRELATERSGEAVVKAQCARCHKDGVGGAPRIGDRDAWVPHLKVGLDALTLSAIRGHGGMPPRGGAANLTDNEIRSAIIYMFTPRGTSPGAPKAGTGTKQ